MPLFCLARIFLDPLEHVYDSIADSDSIEYWIEYLALAPLDFFFLEHRSQWPT